MIKTKSYETIRLTSNNIPEEIKQVTEKLNEVINYINKKEKIAASSGNTRRITPNNGETPSSLTEEEINVIFNAFLTSKNKVDIKIMKKIKVINSFIEEKRDNPVASLDSFDLDILQTIQNNLEDLGKLIHPQIVYNIKLINSKLQNARTTDKEQPLLNIDEYNLICRLLNKEGINSGRIFYVLNRMVDDTV